MSNGDAISGPRPGWTWQVSNYGSQRDTGKKLSWLRCSVQGRDGAAVRLTSQDGGVRLAAQAGSHPEYGPFFCELGPVGAGGYTLQVEGQDAAVDLWLDGSAPATVIFTPAAPYLEIALPPKRPPTILLGRMMAHRGNFLALTRYVARFGAVVTFDLDEAAQAEQVILIGSPRLVSRGIEQQLQQAGVRVERAQGDIAAHLDQAIQAGSPFLAP